MSADHLGLYFLQKSKFLGEVGKNVLPRTYPYLKSSCQELIFDLKEVAFSLFALEWFVDNLESCIILNVLPSTVPVTHIS